MPPRAPYVRFVRRGVCLWAFLVLGAPGVRADIYRWTDAHGIEHFVSSPDQVPPEHRRETKTIKATPVDEGRIQRRRTEESRYDRVLSDDKARDAALASELAARRAERKDRLAELRRELAEVEEALRAEHFQVNKNALRKRKRELEAEIAAARTNVLRPGVSLPEAEPVDEYAEIPAIEAAP